MGTKLVGVVRNRCTSPQISTASTKKASVMRLIMNTTASPKARVNRSKRRLNHAKGPRWGGVACLSIRPHMAGVRVRATKPERATEITIVMANCL